MRKKQEKNTHICTLDVLHICTMQKLMWLSKHDDFSVSTNIHPTTGLYGN